jgi:hypothetical protein
MKKQTTSILIAVVLVVILAALSRVVLYPHNFSPIIALAVFGGAVIKDKKFAFALPLFAMLLSDIIFEVFTTTQGFWGLAQVANYAILGLITIIAFNLKKINVLNVAVYSIMSSVIFFILSNSACFFISNPVYHMYAQNFGGYIACITAGVPFFRTNLIADLVYSGVLFGAYYWMLQSATKNKEAIA